MGRVVHFEISADDPERAAAFYADVFGWRVDKWHGPQDYWLVTTGPKDQAGIDGAIMRRGDNPGQPTVNTVDVDSWDAATAKVAERGGKILTAKIPIPGVGWFAYCQDTEGNTFGVMQADEQAR